MLSFPTRTTIRTSNTREKPFVPTRTRTTTFAPPSTVSINQQNPTRKYSPTAEQPATIRETNERKQINSHHNTSSSLSELNVDDHPQDNEISGSGVDNARAKVGATIPEPTGPFRIDRSDAPTHQAKLNLGAVIALGVFGAFVFLAAVITTVVILIRR